MTGNPSFFSVTVRRVGCEELIVHGPTSIIAGSIGFVVDAAADGLLLIILRIVDGWLVDTDISAVLRIGGCLAGATGCF